MLVIALIYEVPQALLLPVEPDDEGIGDSNRPKQKGMDRCLKHPSFFCALSANGTRMIILRQIWLTKW